MLLRGSISPGARIGFAAICAITVVLLAQYPEGGTAVLAACRIRPLLESVARRPSCIQSRGHRRGVLCGDRFVLRSPTAFPGPAVGADAGHQRVVLDRSDDAVVKQGHQRGWNGSSADPALARGRSGTRSALLATHAVAIEVADVRTGHAHVAGMTGTVSGSAVATATRFLPVTSWSSSCSWKQSAALVRLVDMFVTRRANAGRASARIVRTVVTAGTWSRVSVTVTRCLRLVRGSHQHRHAVCVHRAEPPRPRRPACDRWPYRSSKPRHHRRCSHRARGIIAPERAICVRRYRRANRTGSKCGVTVADPARRPGPARSVSRDAATPRHRLRVCAGKATTGSEL